MIKIIRNTIFIFLTIIATNAYCQDVYISSTRLGDLKISAPLDTVNKYIDTKIKIKNIHKNQESSFDTISTLYKGIPIDLIFSKYFNYETNKNTIELYQISSTDYRFKTKSGIAIGDNKYEILKKLELSHLYIYPDPDKEKSKKYSIVVLTDYENSTDICFYFLENVLYKISISYSEVDGC